MKEEDPKRVGGAIAASIAAHAAIAVMLVVAPSMLPASESLPVDEEFTIEVIEEPEPELAPPEPVPAPEIVPDEPEPEPETPEPEARVRPERTVVPDQGAIMRPESTVTVTPEPVGPQPEGGSTDGRPPVGPPHRTAEEMRILLDPSAVARSSFVVEGPGPTQRRGPQTGVRVEAGPGAMSEQEAEALHSGSMRAQAMARPWLARTHPQLVARPDGSRVYTGHAFTATIRPDGSVEFNDRPGVQTEGFSLTGSFDLGDMAMRGAGQDPYAAEREWFMEETESVRIPLEEAHFRETRERARRRLPGRLEQIWTDESRTPQSRRRLIFRLWDECEEGEADGGTRAQIEEFVRTRIPSGTEGAYEVEELRRLNATRESQAPFQPYR